MEFQETIKQKKGKEKIIMLTAYDYQTAKILDEMKIDLILVGDSLGTVVQGHSDTKSVTMEDMIYHTRAVARGVKNTPIIGDMPINSYDTAEDSLKNALRFLDAGAHGVKIEGNKPEIVEDSGSGKDPSYGPRWNASSDSRVIQSKGQNHSKKLKKSCKMRSSWMPAMCSQSYWNAFLKA